MLDMVSSIGGRTPYLCSYFTENRENESVRPALYGLGEFDDSDCEQGLTTLLAINIGFPWRELDFLGKIETRRTRRAESKLLNL